jgi:hypothetical protein
VSWEDVHAFHPVKNWAALGNTAPMASDCMRHHRVDFRREGGEAKNRPQMNLQTPTRALLFSTNTLLDFRAAYAPLRGRCWMHRYSDGFHAGQCQECSQLQVHNLWRHRDWGTLGEVRRGLGW